MLFLWKIKVTKAFQKILDKSNCKSNKIWVDKSSKFYDTSMKPWLAKDAIEIYSTFGRKSCYCWKIHWKLKKWNLYIHDINIKKNIYVNKLDDKVSKYNNKYHNATKMKPVDIKSDTYITIVKRLMIRILI